MMKKAERQKWKETLRKGSGAHILEIDVMELKKTATKKSRDLKLIYDTVAPEAKGTTEAAMRRKMEYLFEGRAILDELIKEEPKSEYLKEWTKARDFIKEFEDNIKGA